MSIEDDDEDSLGAYIKNKNANNEIDENEIEQDKKEEEEIYHRYEKIGSLTDIKTIKESELTKNYDNEGNKYYNEYKYRISRCHCRTKCSKFFFLRQWQQESATMTKRLIK